MKYDFVTVLDRKGKDAYAWDAIGTGCDVPDRPQDGFDVIPMWIADMNFPTVPTVPAAMIERARHPAYGYFTVSERYYDAIVNWHKNRNGVENLQKEHIG